MQKTEIDFSQESVTFLAGWVNDAIRTNKNTGLPLPDFDLAAWAALYRPPRA